MKKLTIILIAIISLWSIDTNAQSFQKGDNLFNAGFGFGYYGYGLGAGRSFSIPAITANYELGVGDYIGVGPYAGIASYNYSRVGFDGGYSILAFGARASFHFTDILLNDALELDIDEEWDFYATLIFGFNIENYSGDLNYIEDDVVVSFGPNLGFRYFFNENFAVFMEAGYGSFSYGTLGLTVKM
ncbi:hypothetical protein QYS49_09170 [Marivirga salinae]|uniref:Outer membrane protein beta-barrel domain-containing protein n=1 Tax=Marivirga salinarum TaxID=3059078 RepID=A0AA49GCB0_9BACT|nr:hypothetical protein [Marivirga sp. BDSF4-3]WKK77327.1 hypothetical protein QYS49_09170 [Marivirga sp. BDSF4-3]